MRPHAVTSAPGTPLGYTTYTCDANGNRTGGGGLSITYNAENRALSFTGSSPSLTATYDYTGERSGLAMIYRVCWRRLSWNLRARCIT